MKRVLAFLLLLTATAAPLNAHAIHTTLTVVSFDAKSRVLRLSIRAFADDFSRAVAEAAGRNAPKDSSLVAHEVVAYVRSRVSVEGAMLEACGVERNAEAYLLCFTATVPSGVRTVRARNALLTEIHADQVNIMQTSFAHRSTHLFTAKSGPVLVSLN